MCTVGNSPVLDTKFFQNFTRTDVSNSSIGKIIWWDLNDH